MVIDAIRLKEGEKLEKYADMWVALSSGNKEIVCSSVSAKEASTAMSGRSFPMRRL